MWDTKGPRRGLKYPRSSSTSRLRGALGEIAERGPCRCPGRAQAGGDVDGHAFLVVRHVEAVAVDGYLSHVRELTVQEGRVHVDRHRVGVAGGGRTPEPEGVRAAVHLGQPEGPAAPPPPPRLAVVAR